MLIPKGPQQFMINLMYLVLTAMLALYVSAEIFQALKSLNSGLEKSTLILKNNNSVIAENIGDLIQEYPVGLKQYVDNAYAIHGYTNRADDFMGRKISNGNFNTDVHNLDEVFSVLSGGGLVPSSFPFRAKKIPDPVVFLGIGSNFNGGQMKSGTFKAQQGLFALLKNFDFDAKCNIISYRLTRVGFREDPVESLNRGGRFNKMSRKLIDRAKPKDFYYFDEIKA